MATPHNSADRGAFGKVVLMPGDPLRARFTAQEFLEKAELVNDVRGIQGYTGFYEGSRISVMASGMGMPSMGIYSYELFHEYDVDCILRIGSAGSMSEKVHVRDIVLGMGACTDSNYAHQYRLPGTFAPIADFDLLKTAAEEGEKLGLACRVGNLLSSDLFYDDDPDFAAKWAKMGVLAVEMEAAALYMNAARTGKKALAICTISDHLITGEALPSEERQLGFRQMIELALKTAGRFA
ncbi:MAG: purine-nucleoside phosphorylase [Oscillospiraceae bacterium]|nr:purine-nucleoside phosphorylase [Oscillospiraceae bacterium]